MIARSLARLPARACDPWLVALVLAAMLGSPATRADTEAQALAKIERLVNAARTLNYDATFVYSRDGKIDEMRIIHRFADGVERERLVTLSGSAREVLRNDTEVTCIMPDNRSVLVHKRRPQSLYGSPILTASGYKDHYSLALEGNARVAGRRAEIVSIRPRDEYRYGYRLWMDTQTGLLLRSELVDPQGAVLESIVYTSLRTPASIPDELLEPETSGQGYRWHASADREEVSDRANEWVAGWLPPGFDMRDRERAPLPAGRKSVEHVVYGDGLASLSVYVEELESSAKTLEGLSQMGAMNAFGTMIDGHQVTVVGEVPGITVQSVGRSVGRAR
jgi:sigma-E factor negative regulatory protein RseB